MEKIIIAVAMTICDNALISFLWGRLILSGQDSACAPFSIFFIISVFRQIINKKQVVINFLLEYHLCIKSGRMADG